MPNAACSSAHVWLTVLSFAVAILGVVLLALGVLARRRFAQRLEADAPDSSAAARARGEASRISLEMGPPPWDRAASLEWAYSAEARRGFQAAKPVRAEAARQVADAIDRSDTRERELRGSLASELGGPPWRDIIGGVLIVVGAVAALITGLDC